MSFEFRKFIFNSQNYFPLEELAFTENDHCRFVLGTPNTKERKIFCYYQTGKVLLNCYICNSKSTGNLLN